MTSKNDFFQKIGVKNLNLSYNLATSGKERNLTFFQNFWPRATFNDPENDFSEKCQDKQISGKYITKPNVNFENLISFTIIYKIFLHKKFCQKFYIGKFLTKVFAKTVPRRFFTSFASCSASSPMSVVVLTNSGFQWFYFLVLNLRSFYFIF